MKYLDIYLTIERDPILAIKKYADVDEDERSELDMACAILMHDYYGKEL